MANSTDRDSSNKRWKWVKILFGSAEISAGNPIPVAVVSNAAAASTLTTGQNALSTSNEVVLAANATRIFAEVKNADAAINVYLGKDNTVSAANGHLLKPGEAFSFEHYVGAIWAIAASATPVVTFIEW